MAAPTEKSYWWTTGGAGDGSTTYTRTDLATVAKIAASVHGDEGVGDYLNRYGATAGTNKVTIDTGAALVDGKPHICSVGGDITIPSASGAGNTRIDRVVLRADWTAQTVRLTHIPGTDAASPAAPAITQSSGSTYDIPMWQALVDTSGNVSVTDERTWAAAGLAGDGLAANTGGGIDVNVDDSTIEVSGDALQVKADGIDDTKVGNRVPQFYRRQGGDASAWGTAGTTTYTPTTVRMQAGVKAYTAMANAEADVSITFPVAFSDVPIVVASGYYNSDSEDIFPTVAVKSVTASGAVFSVLGNDVVGPTDSARLSWIAVGPE